MIEEMTPAPLGPDPGRPETARNARDAVRTYRRVGLALFVATVLAVGLQVLFGALDSLYYDPESALMNADWYFYALSYVPIYAIGLPAGALILRSLPAERPAAVRLGGYWWQLLLMCFPLMYAGNLVGTALAALLSNGTATNPLDALAQDMNIYEILLTVVVAPLMEEWFFRRQIIDHCRRYGEKTAVLLSAVAFSLFHMNLYQMVYAFLLGWLFGYVYVRTRRLRYTIALHFVINLQGGVIASYMINANDTLLTAYSMVIMALVFGGAALLILQRKTFVFASPVDGLSARERSRAWINAGFILFALVCVGFAAVQLMWAEIQPLFEQLIYSMGG